MTHVYLFSFESTIVDAYFSNEYTISDGKGYSAVVCVLNTERMVHRLVLVLHTCVFHSRYEKWYVPDVCVCVYKNKSQKYVRLKLGKFVFFFFHLNIHTLHISA